MTKFDTLFDISSNILKYLMYVLIPLFCSGIILIILFFTGVDVSVKFAEAWCMSTMIAAVLTAIYLVYFGILYIIGKVIEYKENKKYREEFGDEETAN